MRSLHCILYGLSVSTPAHFYGLMAFSWSSVQFSVTNPSNSNTASNHIHLAGRPINMISESKTVAIWLSKIRSNWMRRFEINGMNIYCNRRADQNPVFVRCIQQQFWGCASNFAQHLIPQICLCVAEHWNAKRKFALLYFGPWWETQCRIQSWHLDGWEESHPDQTECECCETSCTPSPVQSGRDGRAGECSEG